MSFNRYQIPPDFEICQRHIDAALPFNEHSQLVGRCPCCDRGVSQDPIPLCSSTRKLLRIGQEVPLYFAYIRAVGVFLLLFTLVLVIQYFASTTTKKVEFVLQMPNEELLTIQLGFVETARWVRFAYFLLFSVLVLLARGYLKKNKYQAQTVANTLSDRSVMLTNVPRDATSRDIRRCFEDWDLDKIVFTYEVKDYHKSLVEIYQIQKERIIGQRKRESPIRMEMIKQRLKGKIGEAEKIVQSFRVPQNQLDIVFITLRSKAKRDVFLAKYSTGIALRLFYKFCTCCSGSAVLGQHMTVRKAPEPEDIDWLNLQEDYWTKKRNRIACYYMCFAILIYGVMFQYQISILKTSSFVTSILRTIVVFVVNFIIITLLEYTTFQIETHELNSNKVLSLVKKLTFFIFVNLSMSPLAIFLYFQFSKDENPDPAVTPQDTLAFSLLTISIGNIFKPLAEYFNVQRFIKFIKFHLQKRKQLECQLTQDQANQNFEPIPFPLAAFYSLFISSLLTTAFFLSCYQSFILIELLACVVLYWTSKYMLVRVCKQPVGMRNDVSRLSQRILTVSIYVYWLGDKIMYYCLQESDKDVSEYIEQMGAFAIIELILIVVIFFFSSTLIARVSQRLADDEDIESTFLLEANKNTNKINSYEEVNAIILLEEEYKKILKSN